MTDLRRLAEAATPGPWALLEYGPYVVDSRNLIVAIADRDISKNGMPNAAFIAAASPDVILKLLDERDRLRAALEAAIKVADEVRDEWDAAPSGMKAGKLLIALSGHLKGYREDIDAIHSALATLDAEREGGS